MVGLLALGLTAQSLAVRHSALVPLIWLQAVLPGMVFGWLLLGGGLWRPAGGRVAA